ncbi:hypothetical protein [Paenibacillus sp. Leaf72]|uniref:hypothetical protein n=1 Tax=Paenibacillus sp. Leaf72 TaxID=1736234 RepID=UPI0006F41780|nr:hypothetical protein [Paenibacillus sp. Leaf72]KQN97003.1 hypothetical protein ASF12_23325 [Paenibacillus sp. Leaf72]
MNEILNILPSSLHHITTQFKMETFNYEYDSSGDDDREVIDKERKYIVKMPVPVISFYDWVETLICLNHNKISFSYEYAKDFIPYEPHTLWRYFDCVKDNLISNGSQLSSKDKFRLYVYYIEEFNYYLLIRLESHHDIVRRSTD